MANQQSAVIIPGQVRTWLGDSKPGYKNAYHHHARFNIPCQCSFHPTTKELFVADTANHVIRRITASGRATTFAGSASGHCEGEAKSEAQFSTPQAVLYDKDRDLFFVGEAEGHVSMISEGVVSTFSRLNAGVRCLALTSSFQLWASLPGVNRIFQVTNTGEEIVDLMGALDGYRDGTLYREGPTTDPSVALFNGPQGIAVDPTDDSIIVCDTRNHRIRRISDGVVTTIAGDGTVGHQNGAASQAKFNKPVAVVIDPQGTMFIADRINFVIRMIRNGLVSSIVGRSGICGSLDGPPLVCELGLVRGLALDPDTYTLFFTQSPGYIRRVQLQPPADLTGALQLLKTSPDAVEGVVRLGACKFHKALLETRYKSLLALEDTPQPINVSEVALEALRDFIYLDHYIGPAAKSGPNAPDDFKFHCELAYLAKAHGLGRLFRLVVGQIDANTSKLQTVDSLLKWAATIFKLGRDKLFDTYVLALNRLVSLRQRLPPVAQLRELLGDYCDTFIEDMLALAVGQTVKGHEPGAKALVKELSLDETLERLFSSRVQNGTWTIVTTASSTGGDQTLDTGKAAGAAGNSAASGTKWEAKDEFKDSEFKCHDFVLYSRWPYFKRIIDSGLQEAKTRRLKIASDIRSGGLTPTAVQAVLEAIYLGKVSDDTEKNLSTRDKISLLANCELYELTGPHFTTLITAVSSFDLDDDNSVSMFRLATLEFKIDDLAEKALDWIKDHFATIWPKHKQAILATENLKASLQAMIDEVMPKPKPKPPATGSTKQGKGGHHGNNKPKRGR